MGAKAKKTIKDLPEFERPREKLIKNGFKFIPNDIYGLEMVSAVIKIERDLERKKEIKKWSLEKFIKSELKKKTPSPSVRFNVLLNSKAKIKFKPYEFLKNPIIV